MWEEDARSKHFMRARTKNKWPKTDILAHYELNLPCHLQAQDSAIFAQRWSSHNDPI